MCVGGTGGGGGEGRNCKNCLKFANILHEIKNYLGVREVVPARLNRNQPLCRPKKITCVSTNMPKRSVGRKFFLFFVSFYMLISVQNCFLGLSFQQNYYKTYK